MKHLLHLLLVFIVVVACEDAFHSHPYDMNFDGQRNINEENIRRILSDSPSE